MLRSLMQAMGHFYCFLESFISYPNDHTVLGMPIDEDLQTMSRWELCAYIDNNTPGDGSFWDLDSTTKIRFGCQMLRHFNAIEDDND